MWPQPKVKIVCGRKSLICDFFSRTRDRPNSALCELFANAWELETIHYTHILHLLSFSPPPSPLERKDRSAPLCVHTFIALPMTPVTLWHQPLIDNQHSCTCSAHTSPPQGRAEDLQIVAAPPFFWHEARELFRLISVQKIRWFLLEMLLSVEIIQV